MKTAVCLLASLQVDLCYWQCNSRLSLSPSATVEVIPGCYLVPMSHQATSGDGLKLERFFCVMPWFYHCCMVLQILFNL